MIVDPRWVLSLAAVLFALGSYGVVTRRNAIGLLLAVELMANAVNPNLVVFARYGVGDTAQVFALFAIALTVAEVAVGLALVVLLYRTRKDARIELASELSE